MHLSHHATVELQPGASLLSVALIIAASALLAFVIEPHVDTPAATPHAHHVVVSAAAPSPPRARR
jgi:hypothetical protein